MKQFAPFPGVSKVDHMKIIRNVSHFFLHGLSSFQCSPFPIFLRFLHGLEAAFRSCEIKVHMGDLAQTIKTVFIYPVIHIIIKFTYNQLW